MTTPERVYQIALTREQAEMVQQWVVRNIRAAMQLGIYTDFDRERLAQYRDIDAAINAAIAEQLSAQQEVGDE